MSNLPANLGEIFSYLDDLRVSGVVSMYGAAPYISSEFGSGRRGASAALSAWMNTFDPEASPEDRATKAREAA